MPDLSQLETKIRALEGHVSEHKEQPRENKEWRDNRQGDGNIREEGGKTVLSLKPSFTSTSDNGTPDVVVDINGAFFTATVPLTDVTPFP